MKKILFAFVFLFCGIVVFADDFNLQWIDTMSVYLGKRVRDIPDEYKQSSTDKNSYARELPNGIEEGMMTKNNIIVGVIWCKTINSRNILYSEYDKYVALFKNRFGKELTNDEELAIWNWNSRPLMLGVNGDVVAVSLILPDFVDKSQNEWDQRVKELKEEQ
jgi:hypothetical protein